jgi:hypothetical protein
MIDFKVPTINDLSAEDRKAVDQRIEAMLQVLCREPRLIEVVLQGYAKGESNIFQLLNQLESSIRFIEESIHHLVERHKLVNWKQAFADYIFEGADAARKRDS